MIQQAVIDEQQQANSLPLADKHKKGRIHRCTLFTVSARLVAVVISITK